MFYNNYVVYDNKNFDSPYLMDNLNNPDNLCQMTYTKLFKQRFQGASGNDFSPLKSP